MLFVENESFTTFGSKTLSRLLWASFENFLYIISDHIIKYYMRRKEYLFDKYQRLINL